MKEYELFELGARYRSPLLTLAPWKRLLRDDLDLCLMATLAVRRAWKLVAPRLLERARALRIPLQQDVARELQLAVDHGTRMHFIVARQAPGYELLRSKASRTLQRLEGEDRLRIDFIDNADHTCTRQGPRARLIERLDALVLGCSTH